MANEKKINKKATAEKILEVARNNIRDINSFNELMNDEEYLKEAALLWDVELEYE